MTTEFPRENYYIICFDTKDLREINNVYGRGIGDRLLMAIMSWVMEQPEQGIQVYRVKGNEFAVLMK